MIKPLSKENIKDNLEAAGCHNSIIEEFLEYRHKYGVSKQVQFLKCQKCELLEKMHKVQKQIDCLDYLIYRVKKEEVYDEE